LAEPSSRLVAIVRNLSEFPNGCRQLISLGYKFGAEPLDLVTRHRASRAAIRSPIHSMQFTAMLLPSALYRGPSGQSLASRLRHGMSV
jgi:hypothetical protein